MFLSFQDNASIFFFLLSSWLRSDPKTKKQQKLSVAASLAILSIYSAKMLLQLARSRYSVFICWFEVIGYAEEIEVSYEK